MKLFKYFSFVKYSITGSYPAVNLKHSSSLNTLLANESPASTNFFNNGKDKFECNNLVS